MAKSAIQVIDRASRLLELIAGSGGSVPLKVLAIDADLHPSSTFRILSSLAVHGFVERDESGHYQLGRKLLQLGSRVRDNISLRDDARPIMQTLRDKLQETVNLTIRDGDEVVYVERAIARRMMRVEQVIGSRAPLHVTAVGKLFLGEEDEPEFDRYARINGLAAFTPHTITQPDTLRQECLEAIKVSCARDREEAELGVSCVAVPIRDHSGRLVAALSVSAPTSRHEDSWAGHLQEAGNELSGRLGYFPSKRDVEV